MIVKEEGFPLLLLFELKKSLHTKVQAPPTIFTKKKQQSYYNMFKSVGQFWGKLWQFGAIIYMIQHQKSAILRRLAV